MTLNDSLLAAFGLVVADAAVTASIVGRADWAADAHRLSVAGCPDDDDPEDVLSVLAGPLLASGWEEVSSGSSELGDVEILLLRDNDLLTAAYRRPLTRDLVLDDGQQELDFLCQILSDEGALAENSDAIDRTAAEGWSDPLLVVIERYLRGELPRDAVLAEPIRMLLSGVWPWGTGMPHSGDDWGLVHRQVELKLADTGLLG